MAGVVDTIPVKDRIPVYLENWNDYKSAGKGSGYDEKIELAGGMNIFGDNPVEYPAIDPEAVISKTPASSSIVGAGDDVRRLRRRRRLVLRKVHRVISVAPSGTR